jgi:hypothetical protein
LVTLHLKLCALYFYPNLDSNFYRSSRTPPAIPKQIIKEGIESMNRIGIKGFLLIFVVCFSALLSIQAGESNASPAYLYTDQELDNLLAPIALYPDPLLAQMLPASTYPAEIADAEAWLNSGGTMSSIDGQNWDESVKAIAHYPSILKMMAGNMDWTADLGDAFLNQPEDTARSIQRLRWQARETGNLESTNQQTVVIAGDYIEIIPAQPQYIYVPQYDPSVIYIQRWAPDRLPFITFGLGLVIGGWLTMDFDWGHYNVVYHGWNRPGWVNHARPHVHIKNVYVNRSRPYISQKWTHDASHGDPERYRASRPGGGPNVGRNVSVPGIRGSATTPPKPLPRVFGPRGDTHSFSNRGRESRGVVSTPTKTPTQNLGKRPVKQAPSVSQAPPQVSPARGSVQPPKTPSVTFGGYRGDKEARGQSLRGQTSRQSSAVVSPPAAPVTRGSIPQRKEGARGGISAGKDDTRGKPRR